MSSFENWKIYPVEKKINAKNSERRNVIFWKLKNLSGRWGNVCKNSERKGVIFWIEKFIQLRGNAKWKNSSCLKSFVLTNDKFLCPARADVQPFGNRTLLIPQTVRGKCWRHEKSQHPSDKTHCVLLSLRCYQSLPRDCLSMSHSKLGSTHSH